MFTNDLKKDFGIDLEKKQLDQFNKYFEFLIEYNKTTNLTRITEHKEVYYKHFYDSLTLIRNINLNEIITICDIGAGAGFPSIPLKIIYPHLEIVIVDSLRKRIVFLEELSKILFLDNVYLSHSRAEDFALLNQNKFDLVTARAVGSMRIISELALPMVKTNCHFIALKGSNYQPELLEAKGIISLLKSKVTSIDEFELPHDFGLRTNIKIQKEKHVTGYPRTFAQIKNQPI